MGLQMGLFKINTKINSQEQLEEIVSKVEEFNYAKRQFKKLKSINDIINHHNRDILSAITELKENKLIGKGSKIIDGVEVLPKTDLEYLENYTNEILFKQNLYIKYLEILSSNEPIYEIEQLTRWSKYYTLDNYFEKLFKKRNPGHNFMGTSFLLSKNDINNAIILFSDDELECEYKYEIIESLNYILWDTDYENESIYYECW